MSGAQMLVTGSRVNVTAGPAEPMLASHTYTYDVAVAEYCGVIIHLYSGRAVKSAVTSADDKARA